MADPTFPRNMVGSEFNSYRFYDCIDDDIVLAIVKENCGLEVKWLREVLENGIWIRSHKTGRKLKIDRFLKMIEELKVPLMVR